LQSLEMNIYIKIYVYRIYLCMYYVLVLQMCGDVVPLKTALIKWLNLLYLAEVVDVVPTKYHTSSSS